VGGKGYPPLSPFPSGPQLMLTKNADILRVFPSELANTYAPFGPPLSRPTSPCVCVRAPEAHLNTNTGRRAGARTQATLLCAPELNQEVCLGVWGAWEELDRASAQGVPTWGEMSVSHRLNPCLAQGKPTAPFPCLCVFFLWYRNGHVQRGTFPHLAVSQALAGQTMLLQPVSLHGLVRDCP